MTITIVFIFGSVIAYFVLKFIINNEFNQKLLAEKKQLIYELHNFEELRDNYYLNIGDRIELKETKYDSKIEPTLIDTLMFDEYEKKVLPFRTLIFSDQLHGKFYEITITKSLLSNEDLIKGITQIMIGIVSILAISMFAINLYISKSLWNPFNQILDQLQNFQISQPKPITVKESRIDEFIELKLVLDNMIGKSLNDYRHLKEYTENTTHEIQTPLAIIKNKSEMLLQEPLNIDQLSEIGKIYEAAGRLSRLKEGLSLLSKIDNNQYVSTEPINIKEYLLKKLSHFDELIEMKQIKVNTKFHFEPVILLNDNLAYLLITNILSNAIKHNIQKGMINIILKENELTIENTGTSLDIPVNHLFDRFKKSGKQMDSTGLGLSIVDRIITYYQMKITYTYDMDWHKIVIIF